MKAHSIYLIAGMLMLAFSSPAYSHESSDELGTWESFDLHLEVPIAIALAGVSTVAATTCNTVYIARGSYRSVGRMICGVGGTVLGTVVFALGVTAMNDAADDEMGLGLGILAAGAVTAGLGVWNLVLNTDAAVSIAPALLGDATEGQMPGLVAVGRF